MPEQASSTALVPAGTIEGEYEISVKELDAAGKATTFKVPVPSTLTSEQASMMLRAAILKQTTWKQFTFPVILHAVMYADRMGLDIMAGDVYSADGGRIATTAGAKIRHAMATGRIVGYNVEIADGEKFTSTYKGEIVTLSNLKAKVTVWVRGWEHPVIYETTLKEWFMPSNPNWKTRPAYMLRRNALSKALEEVAPMGVDAEEAPPLPDQPPEKV